MLKRLDLLSQFLSLNRDRINFRAGVISINRVFRNLTRTFTKLSINLTILQVKIVEK